MRTKEFLFFAFIISIVFTLFFWPTSSNTVVGISDGDTITVLTPDKKELKVRLAEIDCPEKKQPYGVAAKKVLSDKIFGKKVNVEWSKKDRWGRAIGKVYLGKRYINQEMIEEGYAWHYTTYSHSTELAAAQVHAEQNKLGLWADKNPVAPWKFRSKTAVQSQ